MVSLLMLTIDRYEQTKETLEKILPVANYPYELLVCDNGSQDRAVINYIQSWGPAVHILNQENRGVAKMFNVLMKLAQGQFICTIAPDIHMGPDWLAKMVYYSTKVPRAGAVGIHCVESPGVPTEVAPGLVVNVVHNVFGNMLINREVFDRVGYFNEVFHPYGMEDSDYHHRLKMAGYTSFYIPGMTSNHVGHDMGTDTPYRKMKTESLGRSASIWGEVTGKYQEADRFKIDAEGAFIIDLPQFFGE